MCLVEVAKGPPKPVASCAMPVAPGMEIKTTTPMVKKAREGVMEFLLINHPLDCPICDQGGECDLQDQAYVFGSDRSRYLEPKRGVEDKNLGPFVKTVMTRCIHCTRCVRFAKEVAGVEDLGVTGRGNASEVGTYVGKLLTSELSGNIIDLCPVGALTSKPFAFTARTWELKSTESVDVLDSLGSAIRVDSRGTAVMRVLPRLHEAVNEEWLADKARFAYDGLRRQRLATPLVRPPAPADAPAGAPRPPLTPVTWEAALQAAGDALRAAPAGSIEAVAGKLACAESIIALKDLVTSLGSERLRPEGMPFGLDADCRSSYLFNSTIAGVDSADLILIVGCNPRIEAPVLNARLRRAAVAGGAPVAVLGPCADLTYPTTWLGDAASTIGELAAGTHPFCAQLKAAARPLILVGGELLRRPDRDSLLAQLHSLADATGVVVAHKAGADAGGTGGTASESWNGFCVLHDAGGRVAALDLGFASPPPPPSACPVGVRILLGADDEVAAPSPAAPAPAPFTIYIGSHGDAGAGVADCVLPGAAYTEKHGTYVNTEGRPQRAFPAVVPPGQGRDDWKVLRALSEIVGTPLPYDSLEGVRQRLASVAPHFGRPDAVETAAWLNGSAYAHKPHPLPPAKGRKAAAAAAAAVAPLRSAVENYYQTDAISRASVTMGRATAARKAGADA